MRNAVSVNFGWNPGTGIFLFWISFEFTWSCSFSLSLCRLPSLIYESDDTVCGYCVEKMNSTTRPTLEKHGSVQAKVIILSIQFIGWTKSRRDSADWKRKRKPSLGSTAATVGISQSGSNYTKGNEFWTVAKCRAGSLKSVLCVFWIVAAWKVCLFYL